MPSIFSRARTSSTPSKKQPSGNPDPAYDEFGRVNSRGSARDIGSGRCTPTSLSKQKLRTRTLSTPDTDPVPHIPDGSFISLNLETKPSHNDQQEHDYGYISFQRHVVLGLDEVARLVDVVASELGTRALTTPFIFSTLALDVSASSVRRLVSAFLDTCTGALDAERRWREEARLAGPHELGMCIRWGLARVARVVGGQAVRGLIAWDHYSEFRESEAAQHYPPAHFSTFLPPLPPTLRSILLTLLSLLIRFTAHSASSGHTPPTLSPLFGPLLFGLGPPTLAFHHTYIHYLRAVNATEHLLLSFIRWQSTSDLGVPTRLKEWIRSYPATLPALHLSAKHERPQARRGARTVRVVSVRRNVRMYTQDLVKTAASWSHPSHGHVLAESKEWQRIVPPSLKLPPRYSEAYKKRMDLSSNVHPHTGPGPVPASAAYSASSLSDELAMGLGLREGEERFKSLTELKWGEFESMGFGTLAADEKKLQFDLTESARTARAAKRATLTWTDFSTTGFTRSDAPLSATLQFSTPLTHTISSWPSHNADITKKLKKTARTLPAFGWDVEPVLGAEEVVEEAFVDVFCDLVWGGGWREEVGGVLGGEGPAVEVERECNWALIEFKSLPISASTPSSLPTVTSSTDPRTSTTLVLFEEYVPLEYRQQLAKDTGGKRRLPFPFMSPSSKSRPWKPAATLNGRPYVVGHVPKSPSYREVEFEGLLRSNGSKVLSINKPSTSGNGATTSPGTVGILSLPTVDERPATPRPTVASRPVVTISAPLYTRSREETDDDKPPTPPTKEKVKVPKLDRSASDSPLSPTSARKLASRFRVHPSFRRSGIVPAEYAEAIVDFETRLASYSDDELNNVTSSSAGEISRDERRRSKDDAWVDILVATHNRRMSGQDVETRPCVRPKIMQDPAIASEEVAQVLAGVSRARSPMSDDEPEPIPEASVAPSVKREDPEVDSVISYPNTVTSSGPKRLGYFDLHPERRPAPSPQPVSLDSDDDEEVRYGSPEMPSEFSVHANTDTSTYPQPLRGSMDTEESDYAPTSTHSHQADAPDFVYEDRLAEKEKESGHSRKESMTLPQPVATAPVTPEKGDKEKGRTAALIEMYHEREMKSSMTTPVATSRLPVRSTSLHTQKKEAALPPVPTGESEPVLVTPANEIVVEPLSTEAVQDEEFLQPLNLLYDGTGRDSPGRYVHGAPLQNVIEEEEEGEE